MHIGRVAGATRNLGAPADLDPAKDGICGGLAAALIQASIDRAQEAIASSDVLAMLRAYHDLHGYEL